jgi:hypothetical protein
MVSHTVDIKHQSINIFCLNRWSSKQADTCLTFKETTYRIDKLKHIFLYEQSPITLQKQKWNLSKLKLVTPKNV